MLRETEILHQTMRSWASSECEPHPCGLSVWRYACEISQVPAPALPEHQDKAKMVELLREQGGLEQYARKLMLSLDWEEVEDPLPGDVAVADMPGMGLTCVICSGRLMMAKGDGFVLLRPAPVRAVWRYPRCHKHLPQRLSQRLA